MFSTCGVCFFGVHVGLVAGIFISFHLFADKQHFLNYTYQYIVSHGCMSSQGLTTCVIPVIKRGKTRNYTNHWTLSWSAGWKLC